MSLTLDLSRYTGKYELRILDAGRYFDFRYDLLCDLWTTSFQGTVIRVWQGASLEYGAIENDGSIRVCGKALAPGVLTVWEPETNTF